MTAGRYGKERTTAQSVGRRESVMTDWNKLLEEAAAARENSYCPHSGFAVGAALLTKDGAVYRGCNVENASYGATNCAERTALFTAVADGRKPGDFEAIAVVGGPKNGSCVACPPCGICRQALAEFADPARLTVVWATERTKQEFRYEKHTLAELLPCSFDL